MHTLHSGALYVICMKTILITILSAWVSWSNAQCPPEGDNTHSNIIAADLLKNRQFCPDTSTAVKVSIKELMKDAVTDSFVMLEAYITSAKISGKESCECHLADRQYLDYHIFISDSSDNIAKNLNSIIEVSRYARAINPSLTFDYVKTLVGHKVKIYGYTFIDEEHKSAIGNWRIGIEEIHPVFFIIQAD